MRPRTLIILLVLVLALGAFIWFYERDLPSSDERRERADRVLEVEPDAVTEIRIRRRKDIVDLERDVPSVEAESAEEDGSDAEADPQWRLTEPITYRADEAQIDTLLGTLESLEAERWLEEFDAADLGLNPPRAEVTLVSDDGEVVLLVGAEIPGYDTMAVRREGAARAAVVPQDLWSDLDRPVAEWRDPSLLPARREEIESVRWTLGGETIALKRNAEGDFRLIEPLQDVPDSPQVQSLLTQLTSTQVQEFLPAKEEAGFEAGAPGAVRLELVLAGRSEPFMVLLAPEEAAKEPETGEETDAESEEAGAASEPETRRALLAGETLVTLAADELAALGEPVEEWRSPAATQLAGYQVDRLVLERPEGGFTLERVEADFQRDGEEIAYDVAMDLIDAVTGLEAEEILDFDALEIEAPPLLTVELSGETEEETTGAQIKIYPARERGVPVTVEGRQAMLLVPRSQLDTLQRAADSVASASPTP